MSKKTKNVSPAKSKSNIDGFLALILAAASLVFLSGINADILNFDDNEYFSNYPEVLRLSLKNIGLYFSNYYVMMYQPLPVLSFAVSHALFKFDLSGHHIINLVFHLFNVVLVYRFIGKLNSNAIIKRSVAFLFALHPLAVEPVMWISCRSSGMYAFFYLLGLLAYMSYRESGATKKLFLCGLWFLLSLLSKAHAVTFPLVLLVLDFLHYRFPLSKKYLLEKIPFFALSIIFGIAALLNTDTSENITLTSSNYLVIDYFFIFCYESAWYLFKLLVPYNLSPIYVYPIKVDGMLPYTYYLSFLIIIAIAFVVYKTYKARPYLLFGFAFFYLSIAITFQIVPTRMFIVADRYGYLPNIGIFYILANLYLDWKGGKITWLKSFKEKEWVLYTIGLGMIFLSFKQTKIWENDETLADRIIEVNPETQYVARAYGIRGNYKKNILGKAEDALADYKKASDLDSTDMVSRYQTALIFQSAGDTASAIDYFRKANKADPRSPMPYTDLGVLFSNKANYAKGIECADSALTVSKNFPNALVLKAVCLLNLGNAKEAETVLTVCIKTNPDFAAAYKNRGIIRINNLNNKNGACLDFKKAFELGDAESEEILRVYCN